MKIIPKRIEGGAGSVFRAQLPKRRDFHPTEDILLPPKLLFLVKLKRKLNLIKSIWNLTFLIYNVTVFYIFD